MENKGKLILTEIFPSVQKHESICREGHDFTKLREKKKTEKSIMWV